MANLLMPVASCRVGSAQMLDCWGFVMLNRFVIGFNNINDYVPNLFEGCLAARPSQTRSTIFTFRSLVLVSTIASVALDLSCALAVRLLAQSGRDDGFR
jgi:hypothetical protein